MLRTAALVASIALGATAAPDPALKNARIALRLENGSLLIIGGTLEPGPPPDLEIIKKYSTVEGLARWQPGETLYAVPPDLIRSLKPGPTPRTDWSIGQKWNIYPGAGPPARVVVEKVLFLQHGCISGHDGALARFEAGGMSQRFSGLLATEYLAMPAVSVAEVSQEPLIPVSTSFNQAALDQLLMTHARALVKDRNWEVYENISESERKRVIRMNLAVLEGRTAVKEIRILRWAIPGRKPLLFVQALWAEDELFVFGAGAIVEDARDGGKLLTFSSQMAKWMRMPEFANRRWDQSGNMGGALNAWRIGSRYYVLMASVGYEGYGVELLELTKDNELQPTGLSFGAGC